MDILVNKSVKKLVIQLVLIMLAGAVISLLLAYSNAQDYKKTLITHDYELAGYLVQAHPELAAEVQAAFTADKSTAQLGAGRKLLEQVGYKNNMELFLLPQANRLFISGMTVNMFCMLLLFSAAALVIFAYLKGHYRKIDRYIEDIGRIMKGNISLRLEESDEGSLPKLASSINIMTSSLYAHIEKEKQNRAFMKDILENVSHQLKTPLSALAMYNEIMREEATDNEVIAKFLGKSVNEHERMQTLITNLLKLARLDAGIIELNKKSYLLKDMVDQVVESFETRLQREYKTFEVRMEEDAKCVCDREWMLEALSNLWKNAIEHTGPGNKIKLVVEKTPLIVRITVEDNGEGIHPEDINHVFKRFYRSRFSQNKQGTGIGLTLVKTIVEMHDGFVAVESTQGKGTKFTINLPDLQNCKL